MATMRVGANARISFGGATVRRDRDDVHRNVSKPQATNAMTEIAARKDWRTSRVARLARATLAKGLVTIVEQGKRCNRWFVGEVTDSMNSFPLWTPFELYIRCFRGRAVLATLALAGGTFLIGLLLAWSIGFTRGYLSTQAIYFGVFGIAWVGIWQSWGVRRIKSMLPELRYALRISDAKFADLKGEMRDGLRWKAQVFLWSFWTGLSWFGVYFLTRHHLFLSFPEAWSESPNLIVKNLILDLYAIPINALIWFGAVAIVTYNHRIEKLLQLDLVPNIDVAREKLSGLADFGVSAGLAWSVGISLLVVFFKGNVERWEIAALTILAILGAIMMAWPQILTHSALQRLKDELLANVSTALLQDTEEAQGAESWAQIGSRHVMLTKYAASVADARTWSYNWVTLATVVGTWLLPFITLWLGQFIKALHS